MKWGDVNSCDSFYLRERLQISLIKRGRKKVAGLKTLKEWREFLRDD